MAKNMFSGIGKTATQKGVPAMVGGAVGKLYENYVADKLVDMLPEGAQAYANFLKPLVPGLGGLYLMNQKSTSMQFAGAGMLGQAAGTLVDAGIQALGDDVLADAADELDDIFENGMGDEYKEEVNEVAC